MQLVATHTPTSGMATFDFTEPGGTIGRCPGNHLMLGDDASVGRVQAVVRIKDGHCSLMNVSSRTSMQLNGQALPLLQEAPIAQGDTLTIGDYTLQAWTHAQPVADTPAEDSSDLFKDLLDGPGVLPVGLPAETSNLHPFELDSQTPRNHPDPLQQLQTDAHHASIGTAAHGNFNTEPESEGSHIFSNPIPSTLNLQDPLASQRVNPIDEALTQGHVSDRYYENR